MCLHEHPHQVNVENAEAKALSDIRDLQGFRLCSGLRVECRVHKSIYHPKDATAQGGYYLERYYKFEWEEVQRRI